MRTGHDISIKMADNGIILQIGCKTLVFGENDVPRAMDDLKQYILGDYQVRETLHEKYFPSDYGEPNKTVRPTPQCPPPTGAEQPCEAVQPGGALN